MHSFKQKRKAMLLAGRFLLVLTLLASCQQAEKKAPSSSAEWKNAPEPLLFAEGLISTGDYETHAALSPTGDTVYFLKCSPDLSACTICVSYKKTNRWSSPEVASFSGKYLDVDPFVTKDGNAIYFVSNRPYKAGDTLNKSWDIWKTERMGNGWKEPVPLDSAVNSEADEYYPTISDNGDLYFGSSRPGGKGGADIYCSKLVNDRYAPPENLGDSVNTADNEYEAFIAPDERYLLFMATVPSGLANADFFISYRRKGQWTKAKKLPEPVNSSATEWAPKVSRDGKYFYFGSTRSRAGALPEKPLSLKEFENRLHQSGNGLGDVYYMNASSLPLNE